MVPAAHDIEDRIRDACPPQTRQSIGCGYGATLPGLQPSVLLQAIIGLDTAGCPHGERLAAN
jgi:hypothetical protein